MLAILTQVSCYSSKFVAFNEYQKNKDEIRKQDEIQIITRDKERYRFSKSDYYIVYDTLRGKGARLLDDKEYPFNGRIALSDIESVQLERIDWLVTGLVSFGIISVVVGTIALIGVSELSSQK